MCVLRNVYLLAFLLSCCSDWHKAAEAAAGERNLSALDEIQQRQGRNDAALSDYIKQLKMKLGAQ